MPRVVRTLSRNIRAPNVVYIGRPSRWGNPYVIGEHGTRDEVIEKFREYLKRHPKLVAEGKRELRGKDLACWCAPAPCHGDVWLSIVNEESGNLQNELTGV